MRVASYFFRAFPLVFGLAFSMMASEQHAPTETLIGKLSRAASDRDKELLLELVSNALTNRGAFTPDNYARILVNGALGAKRLSISDAEVLPNAYSLGRAARESIEASSPEYGASAYLRIPWEIASYRPTFDERSFIQARKEEAELRISLWKKLLDGLDAAAAHGKPTITANQNSQDPNEQNLFRAQAEQHTRWIELERNAKLFSEQTTRALGAWYSVAPLDFSELRGLVVHYLHDSSASNAWQSIVVALPRQLQSQAAAAYPEPPKLTARRRLLPEVVSPSKPVPGLPAIAKPNRIVEAMLKQRAAQSGQIGVPVSSVQSELPAVTHPAGSSPGWVLAALGLVALAGGWVWLRQRS